MIRTLFAAAATALFLTSAAVAQTSVPTSPEPVLADVFLGSPDAPVLIEEYASMTCSHCAAFSNDVFPQIKQNYIDTGKVRFVVKPFPLDPISAGAFLLARCEVDDADMYYERVEHLFKTQATWLSAANPGDGLLEAMSEFGMTEGEYNECLSQRSVLNWILQSRDSASEIVSGTPTFVINGVVSKGNMPFENFAAIIDPIIDSIQ